MGKHSLRMREAASVALLAASVVLTVALDDPTPSVVPFVAGLLLAPWRKWKHRRGRRSTQADLVAGAAFLGALMLTLLMPDGPIRWLVISALAVAWVSSWWLLDPDR